MRGFVAVVGLVAVVAPGPRAAAAVIAELVAPADRQVVQRGDDDAATVAVRGRVGGPATRLWARARVRPGGRGVALPWRPLEATIARDGRFDGRVRLAAGGWYELQLCAETAGRFGPVARVARVGVGEVFVVAGQSNAGNFGDLDASYAVDDRVSATDGARWVRAANPLPFAQGQGGSPWVYMANRLAAELGVPIGLCPVAHGATGLSQWQPGTLLFEHLRLALAGLRERGGLRAVLWHQGENDRDKPPDLYGRLLTTLIVGSRVASGVDVPWGIARVSYGPGMAPLPFGADGCDPRHGPASIRMAQCAVARTLPRCFPGPTTDDLGPVFRETTYRIHLNVLGLSIHGRRWADVLLGTPGLIPGRPGGVR